MNKKYFLKVQLEINFILFQKGQQEFLLVQNMNLNIIRVKMLSNLQKQQKVGIVLVNFLQYIILQDWLPFELFHNAIFVYFKRQILKIFQDGKKRIVQQKKQIILVRFHSFKDVVLIYQEIFTQMHFEQINLKMKLFFMKMMILMLFIQYNKEKYVLLKISHILKMKINKIKINNIQIIFLIKNKLKKNCIYQAHPKCLGKQIFQIIKKELLVYAVSLLNVKFQC
ncbi:hypothetical protein IMG5_013820 [Ichthyophthirius multifiliis]|uniref:Uncharacterized protein n=1 Tax=Ichthyophthirius multifiliis TaxID=5932 RepID=G0QK73_ICHMU|nr:hypothetical protein IMG5_013820 [Ichthyophthirius multifiliis]EGR34381.1 hypothetical protein IMG5_013820 [Ichthyophthirius multifiliis]|eukprot:XP_004039685.1 hypothetical protein IMG5_013820 [Ichthyophthirius multifiliis]